MADTRSESQVPIKLGVPDIRTVSTLSVESRASTSRIVVAKRAPIHVKWEHIHYRVEINNPDAGRKCCAKEKTDKVILDNISGEARAGQLVAIMGPSGSGKTTLLNCLAKRIPVEKGSVLTGSITLNGVSREDLGSKFARVASFVQQDDILFSMQTVDETLLTAAKLRLSKDVPLKEKQQRCDAIIQELGLNKCRHTRIGDAKNRGVSGGERKRTNIGAEMIQDPSVLFLDEPTSGLDSFQALNVVQTLKVLCQHGCVVVMSIHQPRSSIYQLFDQLILLAEGRLVYGGPAGKKSVEYFSKLNFKCPSLYNPADYFLDIVSVDNRTEKDENLSKKRINFLIDSYDKHVNKIKTGKLVVDEKENDAYDAGVNSKTPGTPGTPSIPGTPEPSTMDQFSSGKTVHSSYFDQMQVLGIRGLRQLLRDRFTLAIRLFITLFFALFLAALYSEVDDGQKGIQDKQGILFFITINQSFGPLVNTLSTFTVEKAIVMRERQSKSYHLSSYYLTKLVLSLPLEIIFPLLFSSIVYWIVNLKHEFVPFVIFCIIMILCSLVSISMGFVIGSFAPSIDAAQSMAPLFMILSILFGGFYINSDNIPVWISWLENWSHIRWAYMAFAINEFTDSTFDGCDIGAGDSNCYATGEDVLNLLSFANWTLWEPIRNLIILCCCYHIIAYLLLRFKKDRYLEVDNSMTSAPLGKNKAKNYNIDIHHAKSNSHSKSNLLNIAPPNDTHNVNHDVSHDGSTPQVQEE